MKTMAAKADIIFLKFVEKRVRRIKTACPLFPNMSRRFCRIYGGGRAPLAVSIMPEGKESRMNLQLLNLFYETVKYGSINKAAQNNYLSPATLSRSIKELEREMKMKLFHRTSSGLVLTASGEDFYRDIEPLLLELEQLDQVYGRQQYRPGMIKLTICAHQNSIVSMALTEFYNKHCKDAQYIDISIASFSTPEEVLDHLEDKRYMIGVFQYAHDREQSIMRTLGEKSFQILFNRQFVPYVIVSRNHPLAGQDNIALEELKPYTRLAYIDEKTSNINKCTELDNFITTDVKKRILVKERAQLYDFQSNTDCYYIGLNTCDLKVCQRNNTIAIPILNHEWNTIDMVVICKKNRVLPDSVQQFLALLVQVSDSVVKGLERA